MVCVEVNDLMQYQTTHQAMGTVMAHKAFGEGAELCLAAICGEIDTLEMLMSRFIPESEISRINGSSGLGEATPVSRLVLDILIQSKELSQRCGGLFDVTIGPLVELWGRSKQTGALPTSESIDLTLPLVNYQDLLLDPYQQTARLKTPGQAIDLGGIGKGFAGDRVMEIFREFGITSAYSNIGGNVVVIGAKPDGSLWQIGVQHPRRPQEVISALAVTDKAVVTSGDYQRSYIASEDFKYHHILDPRIGFPATSDLVSVTTIAENAVIADVLSTTLFIAGEEGAMAILRGFPGVEAVLINRELEVLITSGLNGCFHPQTNIRIRELNS